MRMPSFATATIQAFGRQEMAVQKVASAIRSQGGSVSEVLPIMQGLASEIQRITTYGDEQVLEMQSLAAAMGITSSQMSEVVQNAIGLSSALGMDVMTATKAASAAIQGKTTALQEYIPSLAKCKTEAEKLATVQRLASGGFEQARDRVDTLDGRLKQAANAWGDLQEVVGGAFAPAVKTVAGLLGGLCEILTAMPAATKALTISLTSLAVGFAFTKVGGLLKVADSFVGLAGGVRTTTAAMHGLNAACRANPLGLVAGAASLAIMAISSLAEYISNLSDTEDDEAQKRQAAYEARRRESAELRKAAGIVADYEAELKKANATAAETADSIERLSSEIAALESSESNGAENAVENAKRLVDKKRELAELQKRYVESVQAARGFAGGVVCEQTHYVFAYTADLVAVGIPTDEPRRHARRHIFDKVNADGRHAYRERKKQDDGFGGRRVDRSGAVARALQEDVDIDSVQIRANLEKQNGIFQETPNNLETPQKRPHNPDLANTPQRQCSPHATDLQQGLFARRENQPISSNARFFSSNRPRGYSKHFVRHVHKIETRVGEPAQNLRRHNVRARAEVGDFCIRGQVERVDRRPVKSVELGDEVAPLRIVLSRNFRELFLCVHNVHTAFVDGIWQAHSPANALFLRRAQAVRIGGWNKSAFRKGSMQASFPSRTRRNGFCCVFTKNPQCYQILVLRIFFAVGACAKVLQPIPRKSGRCACPRICRLRKTFAGQARRRAGFFSRQVPVRVRRP